MLTFLYLDELTGSSVESVLVFEDRRKKIFLSRLFALDFLNIGVFKLCWFMDDGRRRMMMLMWFLSVM